MFQHALSPSDTTFVSCRSRIEGWGLLTEDRRACEGQIAQHSEECDDEASECHCSNVRDWYCCGWEQWLMKLGGCEMLGEMKVKGEKLEVGKLLTFSGDVRLKQASRRTEV